MSSTLSIILYKHNISLKDVFKNNLFSKEITNSLIEGIDYEVSYKGKFIEVGNYQTIITCADITLNLDGNKIYIDLEISADKNSVDL